jgi:DNA-directed RNA polymerase specialized sigma24 family protein
MAISDLKNHRGGFPQTRLSAIIASASADQQERVRGLEIIASTYWTPVYKYLPTKWNPTGEDAKELTQSFFAEAIEKSFFAKYDSSRARFRTFLRTCIDGFVANENKAAGRIKRGGDTITVPLDFEEIDESAFAHKPAENEIDDYFENEFRRSLLSAAISTLKSEFTAAGKEVQMRLFERYVLEDEESDRRPGYKELAQEFNLTVTTVTNYLAAARREFRKIVLEKLRDLTGNEEEFQREARALLGVDPS